MEGVRQYYCISCKKSFEKESRVRLRNVPCPFCTSELYVRDVTRGPKQVVGLQRKYQLLGDRLKAQSLLIQRRKFQLTFEHNIVEALKKYVHNKEEFYACLKLAKRQTVITHRGLYKHLKEMGLIRRESDIGFVFRGTPQHKGENDGNNS